MKKKSASKCIKAHCLDCAGSNKDVLLCSIIDCPLWQHRCGCHITSNTYLKRIKKAFENYAREFKELEKDFGFTKEDYLNGTEK